MMTLGIIMMQIITMFQPEAIIETGGGGSIAAVELGQTETRLRLQNGGSDAMWTVPSTAYLSDEADSHHPLLRIDTLNEDIVLVFEPLPTTTRIFDFIADERHRWMGVHSAIRSLHIPTVRPVFNPDAEIPDSIERIIHTNSLTELLVDDSIYTTLKDLLPRFRDYVVWKWKLTPHEAYVLRHEQERPMTEVVRVPTATLQTPTSSARTFVNSRMPQPRQSFFQRLFSKKKKEEKNPPVTSHKPRPLSRFEQKMLQETRVK